MNNKDNNHILAQALELLPLYALGLLGAQDKQTVDEALLQSPELQKQLKSEYEMVRTLREEKDLFSLSGIEKREERLGALLQREEFQSRKPKQQETTIGTKISDYFQDLLSGSMSKPQYLGFAAITTLSIALIFAVAVPQLEHESTFYPAAVSETDELRPEKNSLLIGLNVSPDDPRLLKILNSYKVKTSTIAGKDGMYRLSFSSKPKEAELDELLSTLSKQTDLIWFVGEAY